jgi:hypothetical protein
MIGKCFAEPDRSSFPLLNALRSCALMTDKVVNDLFSYFHRIIANAFSRKRLDKILVIQLLSVSTDDYFTSCWLMDFKILGFPSWYSIYTLSPAFILEISRSFASYSSSILKELVKCCIVKRDESAEAT